MPILSKFFASLRKIFKGKPRKKKRAPKKQRLSRVPSGKARPKKKISRGARRKPLKSIRSVIREKKKIALKAKKKPSGVQGKKNKKGVAGRRGLAQNKQKEIIPDASRVSGALVGEVTHFFSKIQVVVVRMDKGNLRVGDRIQVKGRKTDLVQRVASMQVESVDVKVARRGQLIGLKVEKAADVGDKVYRLA